jgi:uncharacterized protein
MCYVLRAVCRVPCAVGDILVFMSNELEGKLRSVREYLRSRPSVLVCYSGGVDSTLLAVLAHQELGDKMAAITVASPLLPPRELERARNVAVSLGFSLKVIEGDELSIPGFANNPPDRCYLCKRYRLSLIGEVAKAGDWDTVMDGSNADDARGHRPGRRASIELGGVSPFEDAGLTKSEIRTLDRDLGLPNWDAPSRPCLATRFPYGMELRPQLIQRVDEAEEELESMGLREFRVRLDSPDEARIEAGEDDMGIFLEKDNRSRLVKKLRGLGFHRVLLDLEGYRSGSMDEAGASGQRQTLDITAGYGKQAGASRE